MLALMRDFEYEGVLVVGVSDFGQFRSRLAS